MYTIFLFSILAEAAVDPSMVWWWDTAQKIGAGASFVLGIGVAFLWRALENKDKALAAQQQAWQAIVDAKDKQFQTEVTYSKERDKQTLTVMLELTNLIKGMDSRDISNAKDYGIGLKAVLDAVMELKTMIRDHFPRN